MEFDTNMKLTEAHVALIDSELEEEVFIEKSFGIMSASAKNIGDAGNGEYWLDYSDMLRIRYVVVNISKAEASGQYKVVFRAGRKPSYIADAILGAIALILFWCLGKILSPEPGVLFTAVFVVAAGALGWLVSYFGRSFGVAESVDLAKKLRTK